MPDLMSATTEVLSLLDRQHARRSRKLPTISVFAGSETLARRHWQKWTVQSGRGVVFSTAFSPGMLIEDWLAFAARCCDLGAAAASWLSLQQPTLGNPDVLDRKLRGMTARDLDIVWKTAVFDTRQPAALLCHAILCERVRNPEAPNYLKQTILLSGLDSEASFVAINLLLTDRAPGLLVIPPRDAGMSSDQFARAAEALYRLASVSPVLPLGISAPPPIVEAYLASSGNSRVATAVREGLIRNQGIDERRLASRITADAEPLLTMVAEVVGRSNISEELVDALADATRARDAASEGDPLEAARSSAERFLFELLQSHPETSGEFELNRSLEFKHGSKAAEADLVATSLRLVIELDGAYYHLRDLASYRNDRRKDWEYQRHGYTVLRFLAEDVLPDLEQIWRTILTAVAHRRASAENLNRTPT